MSDFVALLNAALGLGFIQVFIDPVAPRTKSSFNRDKSCVPLSCAISMRAIHVDSGIKSQIKIETKRPDF
jgi:hypothetical protein